MGFWLEDDDGEPAANEVGPPPNKYIVILVLLGILIGCTVSLMLGADPNPAH